MDPDRWRGRRIVFAGGGSGGHLFPGLAMIELWRELLPDPPEVHWIGSPRRMEATLIPERGIPFHPLDINYFRRSFSPAAIRQNASVLWRLTTGATFRQAEAILREVNADLVISLGSFVGGPVVVAAHHAAIPSVVLALDAVIGKAHRWSAPVADAICVSTDEGFAQMSRYGDKVYFTGTPIRPSLFRGDPVAARYEFNITQPKPTLLVLGGSQGAAPINAQIPGLWEALNQPGAIGLNILHQAGEKGIESVTPPPDSAGSYTVKPFIANMANAYAICDLVLCRAGANTIAELSALGKPAILIPFAQSAENHQLRNAQSLAKKGFAICITEDALSTGRLVDTIRALLSDEQRLGMMQLIAKAESHPAATGDASLVCEGVMVRRGRAPAGPLFKEM